MSDYRVLQHVCTAVHADHARIQALQIPCVALVNAVNFVCRQQWFKTHDKRWQAHSLQDVLDDFMLLYGFKPWNAVWLRRLAAVLPEYAQVPHSKLAQNLTDELAGSWASFAGKRKGAHWQSANIPGYKKAIVLPFNIQTIAAARKAGTIKPSLPGWEGFRLPAGFSADTVQQLRVVPRNDHYIFETVYKAPLAQVQCATSLQESLKQGYVGGVDLGVANIVTATTTNPGVQPVVCKGGPIKAINQYANKTSSALKEQLAPGQRSSKQIRQLWTKRNRQLHVYVHTITNRLTAYFVQAGVRTVVVGYNIGWKAGVNTGARNNQTFVSIPHSKLVDQLAYKCAKHGIMVVRHEEAYTSQASALGGDSLPVHGSKPAEWTPSGRRVQRAWYRTAAGQLVHADVNAAVNIIRKVFQSDSSQWIVDAVVHPVSVSYWHSTNLFTPAHMCASVTRRAHLS